MKKTREGSPNRRKTFARFLCVNKKGGKVIYVNIGEDRMESYPDGESLSDVIFKTDDIRDAFGNNALVIDLQKAGVAVDGFFGRRSGKGVAEVIFRKRNAAVRRDGGLGAQIKAFAGIADDRVGDETVGDHLHADLVNQRRRGSAKPARAALHDPKCDLVRDRLAQLFYLIALGAFLDEKISRFARADTADDKLFGKGISAVAHFVAARTAKKNVFHGVAFHMRKSRVGQLIAYSSVALTVYVFGYSVVASRCFFGIHSAYLRFF